MSSIEGFAEFLRHLAQRVDEDPEIRTFLTDHVEKAKEQRVLSMFVSAAEQIVDEELSTLIGQWRRKALTRRIAEQLQVAYDLGVNVHAPHIPPTNKEGST